jgi:signal transduction histidine kinase
MTTNKESAPMINVLLAEDCKELAEFVEKFLSATGEMTVEVANNPLEAIEILKTKNFDLIISDYQMPKMTGIGFLKYVRSDLRNIPFIIFTGKSREEVVIEAINEGVTFYLQKGGDPVSQFAELIHKIKHAVAKKRLEDSLDRAIRTLQLLNSTTMHDLRNLLTVASTSIELSQRTEDLEQIKKLFNRTAIAIDSCLALIEEASDYHKVGINRHNWYLLKDIISEQGERYPNFFVKNNIEANLEIFIDSAIIKNVFSNLLDNSKRHGGENVKEIVLFIIREENKVKLIYEDDGVGIDLDIKAKIFTHGFGKNTGLGLFLVKELLEMTDMTISETGCPGKGVRFEIVIPPWKYRLR